MTASSGVAEVNWSGTYRYRADQVHTPRTLAELQQLVRSGGRLHPLGTRHSFNGVADGDALVSVAELGGSAVVDPMAHTVTVPAGIRYGDLTPVLERAGWALDNLASLPHISVAGSVATATHGSGNTNQSLAAAVAGMVLVDGTGTLVRLGPDSPDLAGAVVGLGALGVVVELTLAIEPAYQVRQDVYERLPWTALTESFADVMGAGYSVSAVTDFAGDTVEMLWVKSRTDTAADMPAVLFGATAATEQRHLTHGNDPYACTPQLGLPGPWYDRLPHFRLEFTPSSGAEIQSEWLMDRAQAADVIEALRSIGPRIASTIRSAEIRTVAAEGLWLSSAYERDVFGVHFTWHPDAARVDTLVGEVESVLAPFAPRPHWGKVFGPAHDWAALYPRLADFRRLVERYDPDGVFRNDFLRRTVLA
jgi:xylitol oxidase